MTDGRMDGDFILSLRGAWKDNLGHITATHSSTPNHHEREREREREREWERDYFNKVAYYSFRFIYTENKSLNHFTYQGSLSVLDNWLSILFLKIHCIFACYYVFSMHYNYYKTHLFENSVLYFFILTKNRDIQMYLCSKYRYIHLWYWTLSC